MSDRLPWRAANVDPKRLARAFDYVVQETGKSGEYCVFKATGTETYWVNLRDPDFPACDCGDHAFRDLLCKHALAALIAAEDPRIVALLGAVVRQAWLDRRLVLLIAAEPIAATAMSTG